MVHKHIWAWSNETHCYMVHLWKYTSWYKHVLILNLYCWLCSSEHPVKIVREWVLLLVFFPFVEIPEVMSVKDLKLVLFTVLLIPCCFPAVGLFWCWWGTHTQLRRMKVRPPKTLKIFNDMFSTEVVAHRFIVVVFQG